MVEERGAGRGMWGAEGRGREGKGEGEGKRKGRGEEERERAGGTGKGDVPSIFFNTRSTAPEQPPQLMLMLNL